MKKFPFFVIILACVLLFSGCSAASLAIMGRKIVLPNPENISGIVVTDGGETCVIEDEFLIARMLRQMGEARYSGRKSSRYRPVYSRAVQIDFIFREGGTSTLFLYRDGEKLVLEQPYQEQPYQAVFEAGEGALDFFGELD